MIVSIPLIAILAIVAWIAYRHMGLRLWQALVCIILGFLLAATGAAPDINEVLAAITHWFGGRPVMNPDTSQQITTRNDIARDIIAGFASAAPTLADVFRFVDSALADVSAVLAELQRTRAELEGARLDRANLLAAMRATITADTDGEADPLYYLRDELQARQGRSQGRREAP